MSKQNTPWKKFRHLLEYSAVLLPYHAVRILPRGALGILAHIGDFVLARLPYFRVVTANVAIAFPEKSPEERMKIARRSNYNLFYNLFEFVWMSGRPDRIERCCRMQPVLRERIQHHLARNERMIFITPHMGSWEASGIMAPYFGGADMAAIAKPVRNPHLDKLLNRQGREKVHGMHVIFSHGAIRAATKALLSGRSVATLIDQNTSGREGGVFVDFFGVPVSSSAGPAGLVRICAKQGVKVVILFGGSLRMPDGMTESYGEYLDKPFEEYASDTEIIQELIHKTEDLIRRYPDQYLWCYRRFRYIPKDISPEVRARYPYYAYPADDDFYGHRH